MATNYSDLIPTSVAREVVATAAEQESTLMQLAREIYDLRSTFASNALAAGVTVFELARMMGRSMRMIEKHYGTLLEGASAGIATRLAELARGYARTPSGRGGTSRGQLRSRRARQA
jgi:hypothetical protein